MPLLLLLHSGGFFGAALLGFGSGFRAILGGGMMRGLAGMVVGRGGRVGLGICCWCGGGGVFGEEEMRGRLYWSVVNPRRFEK